MAEPPVDFTEVLYRLTLYAQSLSSALVCVGLREGVLPGGEAAGDLAMETIKRFLDPADGSVAWSEKKGPPTTTKVVAYLKKVLYRDFLDLKKKKRFRTTVYVGTHESDEEENQEFTLDDVAAGIDDAEEQVIKREQREWVLKQFDGKPELRELVALQLDPEGYKAFSNQELAELKSTTVEEIEKMKKRIKRILTKLAASGGREGGESV